MCLIKWSGASERGGGVYLICLNQEMSRANIRDRDCEFAEM